jgi:hypothetical protein
MSYLVKKLPPIFATSKTSNMFFFEQFNNVGNVDLLLPLRYFHQEKKINLRKKYKLKTYTNLRQSVGDNFFWKCDF